MLMQDEFDYVVVNYDNKVEDVVAEIDRIIETEKNKRMPERYS
jgi:guanylate kinase